MKSVFQRAITRPTGTWLAVAAVAVAACIWPIQQLRALPEQQRQVAQELMQVQALAAQAQRLAPHVGQPVPNPSERLHATVASTLGAQASVQMAGDRAILVLHQAEGEKLVQALAAVRASTSARFTAAHWSIQAGRVDGRVEMQFPVEPQ